MPRTRMPALLWSPWSVSRRVAAPAEVVWNLLTDPEQWPAWGPTVLGGVLDTDVLELGSTGRVQVPPGVWLPFEVTRFEPGAYWAWQVAGVPATGHRVVPESSGCRVVFEVPWWAPAYAAVCALALRRIDVLATRG